MTPEAINFVRKWAKEGNEPRPTVDIDLEECCDWTAVTNDLGEFTGKLHVLSDVGLTIAVLADAQVQANEVAEYLADDPNVWLGGAELETMRQKLKELIG